MSRLERHEQAAHGRARDPDDEMERLFGVHQVGSGAVGWLTGRKCSHRGWRRTRMSVQRRGQKCERCGVAWPMRAVVWTG